MWRVADGAWLYWIHDPSGQAGLWSPFRWVARLSALYRREEVGGSQVASPSPIGTFTTINSVPLVVLVPGYGGRLRAVERWRMAVALQTLALHHGDGLLVASGYRGEAERLARLAQGHRVVQEPTARSTYENVERSLSFFEDADQIAIASDHFHVRRASRYLRQLRPDLSSRLIPAKRRWRNGGWWIQPGGAAYEALLEAKRRIRSAR